MKRFFILAVTVSSMVTTTDTAADIIFESGTLGPTGISFGDAGSGTAPGGSGVTANVFSGVRFQLSKPVKITRVGGHFVDDTRTDSTFFGALARLESDTDFPDSGDLSTPDVVGETTLAFPDPSTEVFGDLELLLEPGWYALVFGSGLFGATGSGAAVLNNPDIRSPSYIAHQTGSGWLELSTLPGPFRNFRLVVEGIVIPEPSSLALVLLTISCLLGYRSFGGRTRVHRGTASTLAIITHHLSGGFNGLFNKYYLEFCRRHFR